MNQALDPINHCRILRNHDLAREAARAYPAWVLAPRRHSASPHSIDCVLDGLRYAVASLVAHVTSD